MQIKSYNRAVDPNTIQGQEQAPNNVNAFGGNTAGLDEEMTKQFKEQFYDDILDKIQKTLQV